MAIGTLLMAFSEKNRTPVLKFILLVGFIGLIASLWAVFGSLLFDQCSAYGALCDTHERFESYFGQFLQDKNKAAIVFLVGSGTGLLVMLFVMFVGSSNKLNYKFLIGLGCLLFLFGVGAQFYDMFTTN